MKTIKIIFASVGVPPITASPLPHQHMPQFGLPTNGESHSILFQQEQKYFNVNCRWSGDQTEAAKHLNTNRSIKFKS